MDKLIPIPPHWPRVKFNSTLLSEAAYDEASQKMYVHFATNDTVYEYEPVKKDKFLKMAESPSAGAFFTKHFKTNKSIKCKKVQTDG